MRRVGERRVGCRRRNERGAVAVVVAMVALILMIMAAFAVDMGHAYVAKRDAQKHADLAALAAAKAGNNLPAPNATRICSYGPAASAGDQPVIDAADYLARVVDAGAAPSAAALVDCVMANGEVVYGNLRWVAGQPQVAYDNTKVTLVTPNDRVDFGFAKVVGIDGTDVGAQATVAIRSPQFSALPFYAFSGCDYGLQTLQQPNNGHSADPVMLYAPSDTNNAVLTGVTPTQYPAGTPVGTLQPIDITGTNLAGVTEVGFFESGLVVEGPPPVVTNQFTVTATGIHIDDLPEQARGVTTVQQYWYVRVKIGGKWSPVYKGSNLNAPVLTIGEPPMICDQGSSQGNFGTLDLSNHVGGGKDAQGAANVALGLDSTLGIYPVDARPADGLCSAAQPATKFWPTPGTNCVKTDTGMSAKVATGGFIGVGSSAPAGKPGLLAKSFTTRCGPDGTPATTVKLGVTINNDPLTCFLTDPTVHLGDIYSPSYAGPPVLSSDIYNSPRFGYVPVLATRPGNGASQRYQIIEFRPSFITDQTASAMKGDPPSASNGIITKNNSVESVQVVFLSAAALPPPPTGAGTTPWQGSGPKILQLVD